MVLNPELECGHDAAWHEPPPRRRRHRSGQGLGRRRPAARRHAYDPRDRACLRRAPLPASGDRHRPSRRRGATMEAPQADRGANRVRRPRHRPGLTMPGVNATDLGPVAETLLIPLYGRATLTRQGSALIDDPTAVEMVEAIDYDFSRFDGAPSLFGAVLRTRVLDVWIQRWLSAHPAGTVVEIGAGLNTRFERLDNGLAHWLEVDLPDAMTLRRRFF